MKNKGFTWHCHHDILLEWCYDYKGRVEDIKKNKPKHEIKTRLKLFKFVKGKLPIEMVKAGDLRRSLAGVSLNQSCVSDAPVTLIIAAIPSITEVKYGNRSMRYIDQEAGAVMQNVYLQCESLGLGTVCVGAFHDDQMQELMGIDAIPRIIMPIGAIE